MEKKEKVILGIDPGTNYMGYGVVKTGGEKPELIDMGVLDMKKGNDPYDKLKRIFDFTNELIQKHRPQEFAIEAQFFGKNVQSMLKLGRAQGISIVAAMENGLTVAEYAPLKIKQSITGNGMASKEQVAAMLRQYLHIDKADMPEHLDATDAIAVALCHHFETSRKLPGKKSFSSWSDFAKQNESRVSRGRKATKETQSNTEQNADTSKTKDVKVSATKAPKAQERARALALLRESLKK
ncbi:MAG: crossover junction endodeoxyribonuclease RuvC [Bacteroidales bacterium]|nr:crossover junction endodeoxyribonuclease RuvC [Candidatus Physcocola equi]